MNSLTDYLIDWTRVGELLRSGTHRYSYDEMIQRGFIIILTLSPVMYYREFSLFVLELVMICFFVSHLFIISPLIIKRWLCKMECNKLIAKIKSADCVCTNNSGNIWCEVCVKIHRIMESSVPNGKASATWGRRKRLLKDMLDHDNNK